ncbi:MAG TPA: YncE family protein, partial [Chthonomonadaceae bacterium]|nr:YncE family protein [Chthonomonadaceae bacterium]
MHRTPICAEEQPGRRAPKALALLAALMAVAAITRAGDRRSYPQVGRQPDGSFIVSTCQRIVGGAIAFRARPTDIALHPSGAYAAVLDQGSILFVSPTGVVPRSHVLLEGAASYRGIAWSPDGKRLFASVAAGFVQELVFRRGSIALGARIAVKPDSVSANARPGGMAITRDGKRLFVALADRNSVAEIDLVANRLRREYGVQNVPFEVRLSADESALIVTNWGGRLPTRSDADDVATSGSALVVVDPRGAASTGTVSIVRRATGETRTLDVGLHPTAIAVDRDRAFVTNSGSDSLSEIDVKARRVVRSIPLTWRHVGLFGSMPCALAIRNGIAYVCNGGDNAVCVVDLARGRVKGYLP